MKSQDTTTGEARTQTATSQDIARYRKNMQAEVDSAALYTTLAEVEKQPQLADAYRRLAGVETEHARFWAGKVVASGAPEAWPKASWRANCLIWLARRWGPGAVLPTMIEAEEADTGGYVAQPEAKGTKLATDEQTHRRFLQTLIASGQGGMKGTHVAQLEGRHRAVGGNALRAAVLGANDGLVSNLSLVMGVAGAAMSGHAILITGLAGLLAGAISMALGEWLSVQSSRELYQRQLAIESEELKANPAEEEAELALIFEVKGMSKEQALAMAARVIANDSTALDTLAREELGIDPEELGGSAWEAAISSFLLFAVGAIIPVGPFLFLSEHSAVAASLVGSAVGLFAIGSAITIFTGRSVLFSGSRQMLFGLAAAAVTYGIGWAMGVSLGG